VTILALAVTGRGLVDPTEPVIRADDEALLRGRAAFETLRVYGGRPFRLEAHFDRVHDEKERVATRVRRDAQLRQLGPADVERAGRLEAKQQEIMRLAAENPQFTLDLLFGELVKLGRLVDGFLELALNCTRYEQYLGTVDFDDLESELRRWREASEEEKDPQLRATAKKNLDVLLRRQEKLGDLRRYTAGARAQLDLIENTFRLIGDQILTMQSPAELGGQLDELIDGVEAVRSTAAERDRLLQAVAG